MLLNNLHKILMSQLKDNLWRIILHEQIIDRITVQVYGLTWRLSKAHRSMRFHHHIVLIQACFFKGNNIHELKANGVKECLPFCNPREKVMLSRHLYTAMLQPP